jgi:predicted outer membrane protein
MRISLPWATLVFVAVPTGSNPADEKKAEPLTDVGVVSQATNNGPAEVALGKLAVKKVRDIEVKRLGEQLAADRARANAELGRIAREVKFAALDTAPKRPGRS